MTRISRLAALAVATIGFLIGATTGVASASPVSAATHNVALFGTKTLIAVVIVVLIVAGGAGYWFSQRGK